MPPPPVGSPEYRAYLDNQNDRKRNQRLVAKKLKQQKAAKPFMKAAVARATKDLRAQLQEQVQKKNRFMRELSTQRAKAASCMALASDLENRYRRSKDTASTLRKELKEAKEEVERMKKKHNGRKVGTCGGNAFVSALGKPL